MEDKHENLSDVTGTVLAVKDARTNDLGLDENLRTMLHRIKTDYETVFSWDIDKLTGKSINNNLISNFVVRIRERCESTIDNDDDGTFNLNR